jgi:hypothetical protein
MSVLGVDLSPIQPSERPSNCSFRILNVETGWDSEEKFDLIHTRAMITAFTDWPRFFQNCYKYYFLSYLHSTAYCLQASQAEWLYRAT